ncbi:hydrolase [Moraxella nasovis]|uniref:CPCC family cysteine-rich protein n=1 Tax=Moraxella nasovis TaxID=2904121 RepID=UPI001F624D07|nr:CPCC family cysteine-rich protein [Moraxella nasovis]UNU73119.1 hydrolase [Moraxella nasovis]
MNNFDEIVCYCCGYLTVNERGGFDICPVCFWEDDWLVSSPDEVLHLPSMANNGLTLYEARQNYQKYKVFDLMYLTMVRPPLKTELPKS